MQTINCGFEKIKPTPEYPKGFEFNSLIGLNWESKSIKARIFREKIKEKLRQLQNGRCCYCRRHLGDPDTTHIEHFIEKSHHPNFTYLIKNLSLSCSICNRKKEEFNKKFNKTRNRIFKTKGKICPYASEITENYPENPDNFRIIHPHFDNYSENIEIHKSWIFIKKTKKGLKTIKNLKLNELAAIEKRKLNERICSRTGLAKKIIQIASETNEFSLMDFKATLIKLMRINKK